MVYIYTYLFILGAVLGSFYNVVGLRVPENVSIVRPRSHCATCHRTLGAVDLIPVLSYLLLRGKSRCCGNKISMIYPIVELVTGLLFLHAFYWFGLTGELAVALTFISLLVIIFVSDIVYMIIPDKVLLFFIPVILVERMLVPLNPWWDMFAGAFIGFGLLYLIAILSKGGMGGGDIKLFFVIGLVLGLKLTILAFFISTLIGALYGILGMGLGKLRRSQPIPFGPFIAIGALVSYFYGNFIMIFYFDVFNF
ncbi:A24 family peptidase [Bacillus sp. V5-8f]|uniref:prepilin peptidase n=1 Tax=Bacillus sp. V5-8f TaxID=2053044 RepID=UPI000C75BFE4|nr:A24 family peptidase [Bacillus sp. V5-8f]PLT32392.1 prepilin peptidase [Bacillus sp. V5-8f]